MSKLETMYLAIRKEHVKLNSICEEIFEKLNAVIKSDDADYWDLHDQVRRNIVCGNTCIDYLRSAVEENDTDDFVTSHRDMENLLNWTTNIFDRILDEYTEIKNG